MKLRLGILLLLLFPIGLQGNPAIFNPQSLIAFVVVAFWALVIESGIATLAVGLCGVLVLPVFTTLVITNVGVFAFGFMPLLHRMPLWLLELLVVIFDAIVIKVVAAVPLFQRGDYVGVSWRRGLIASILGNAASYFIGVIGSHTPWMTHEIGGLE
jgi:hypothetical protein